MISKLILSLSLIAFATASCPNDCSQHGRCNEFSACVCYRNWMGADCSERVCPFGHAFIDTPQGDLNADGRVDRPTVQIFTVVTDEDLSSTPTTFPSNILLFDATLSGDEPNDILSVGITVASSTSKEISTGVYGWEIPVIVPNNDVLQTYDLTALTIECAYVVDDQSQAIRNCKDVYTAGSGNSDVFDIIKNEVGTYTYNTQFTNSPTWELYPSDHAAGKPSNQLTKFWDEAHFYAECSGKGMCNRDSGQCECFPGYTGVGCGRVSCPNECSGHGVCSRFRDLSSDYVAWDRNKTQACVCDAGYDGIDCSKRKCPHGDDPITRNTDPANGASKEYVNSPHLGGQEAEIQTFGRLYSGTGAFALEFTDEFNDKWVTKSLDWDATAAEVEAALEALPNSVVQDVIVHESTAALVSSAVGDITGALQTDFKSWTITFISNSGNIPALGVRYSWSGTINSVSKLEEDNAGQFRTLERCGGSTTGCLDQATSSGNVDVNDDVVMGIGVCSFRDCLHGGTVADGSREPVEYAGDTTGDDYYIFVDETDATSVGNINVVFHTTGRPGSQENVVCSNRGLCDYSSGLCKCFNGFTDDDCSRQNALAMY